MGFVAHLTPVLCFMKVIVAISFCGPGHFLSVDYVLCVVPFAGEHLITEVILDFNLETVRVLVWTRSQASSYTS